MGIIIIAMAIGITLGVIGFGLTKTATPGEVNDRGALLVITALMPFLVIGFGATALITG